MRSLLCSAVLLLLACGGEEAASPAGEQESAARAPRAPTGLLATRDTASRTRSQWNRLEYHGGPMMMGPDNVYVIWYGQWSDSPVQPVLVDFLSNLGGSPYFGVVSTYPNPAGVAPANALIYSGAFEDWYSWGATLTRSDIMMIVSQAAAGGDLPVDPDAIYLVLPSPDVSAVGHCESYCALHGATSANNVILKYAFIGNTTRCPSKCQWQYPGPNGYGPADAMASLIAAELFDSVTDPERNAWYDQSGLEPASKCAWTFGTTYEAANGALANVRLGGKDYLLQQLWVNQPQPPHARGYCATSVAP